jgi:hypothetical protein
MTEEAMVAALRENNLITKLKEKFSTTFDDQVTIKLATGAMRDLEFHFMTVGNAFRFEADRARKEAVAGFNNPEVVKGLNAVWQANQGLAKQLALRPVHTPAN